MKEDVVHKTFLTVADIAEWLRVSPQMVYKQIKIGDLPAVKIGRRLVVSNEDVQRFIEKKQTSAEPCHM